MGQPHSLQEKFQITVPSNDKNEDPVGWLPWKRGAVTAPALGSARESQDAVGDWKPVQSDSADFRRFNEMPPGMGIDQCRTEIDNMPLVMAGESDVSADTNKTSFREGFKRTDLKGTDDQYTGEHMDHFYGEAVGDDGAVGFVERNNYLDRM